MDRRWRSQSSISIDDRESGKIRLNLDELLKTPPKSPFLIDNMSISISKTGLIFPSSSNNPNLFDFATNNKRQIIEEKFEDILLCSLRFVQGLLVPVPAQGAVPCKHTLRTRYTVYGTYLVLVPGIVLHLASRIVYLGFGILTFYLASGMIIMGP